jgi:hypothetical protein
VTSYGSRILWVSSLPPGIWLRQRTRVSSSRRLAFHANYIPSLVNGHRILSLNILTQIRGHSYSLKILEAAYHVCSSNVLRSYLFFTNSLIFWVIPFIFDASDNATKGARAFWERNFSKSLNLYPKIVAQNFLGTSLCLNVCEARCVWS